MYAKKVNNFIDFLTFNNNKSRTHINNRNDEIS